MRRSYSDQLLDPRWQKLRLEKLSMTDFCCEICGASHKTLHVHHKQYFKGRDVWEYAMHELAVLCDDCHKKEHEFDEKFKELICLLNIDGPLNKEDAYWLLAGFVGLEVKPEWSGHECLYKAGSSASDGYWKV